MLSESVSVSGDDALSAASRFSWLSCGLREGLLEVEVMSAATKAAVQGRPDEDLLWLLPPGTLWDVLKKCAKASFTNIE